MFCNLEQKTSFNLNCEFENNTRLKRSKVKILGVVDTGSEVVQRKMVRWYMYSGDLMHSGDLNRGHI